MATKIEWAEDVWNPVTGCDKVSRGCKNCYALQQSWARMHNPRPAIADKYAGTVTKTTGGNLQWTGKINYRDEWLHKPLQTKKPTLYFLNSMSDIFHKSVPYEFVVKIWAVMLACPQHTFIILTKRPDRMADFMQQLEGYRLMTACDILCEEYDANSKQVHALCRAASGIPLRDNLILDNVWLGTSVEDQQAANERLPVLLRVPAKVRLLSCEPLTGPLDLTAWLHHIHWVITGGESGKGATPVHPEWVRSLRDQCERYDVPFFFKQWGDYWQIHPYLYPPDALYVLKSDVAVDMNGKVCEAPKDFIEAKYPIAIMSRLGKKNAGNTLDGKVHMAMPYCHTPKRKKLISDIEFETGNG